MTLAESTAGLVAGAMQWFAGLPFLYVLVALLVPLVIALVFRSATLIVWAIFSALFGLAVRSAPSMATDIAVAAAVVGGFLILLTGLFTRRRRRALEAEIEEMNTRLANIESSESQRLMRTLKSPREEAAEERA